MITSFMPFIIFGAIIVALFVIYLARGRNPCWMFPIAIVAFVGNLVVGEPPTWVRWIMIVIPSVLLFWAIICFIIETRKPSGAMNFTRFCNLSSWAAVISVGFFIVFLLLGIGSHIQSNDKSPSPSPSSAAITNNADKVLQYLYQHGWEAKEITTTEVDATKDNSTSASGAFNSSKLLSVKDLIAFLNSKSESSKTFEQAIAKETGATIDQIRDLGNWVAIQSKISFIYPGNTRYKDGEMVDAGQRDGGEGDIFFAFVAPGNGKIVFVRGACTNPQTIPPKPTTSEPEPTKKPESTNPNINVDIDDDKPDVSVIIDDDDDDDNPPYYPPYYPPDNPKDDKIPRQDPAAQSNAPTGGGTNADPGPGSYTSPNDVEQPQNSSRINPEAPSTGSTIPDTSTVPPPESGAPAPSQPANGVVAPPGM